MLEIDPSEKRELYDALTRDGMTLKDWFLRNATDYLLASAAKANYSHRWYWPRLPRATAVVKRGAAKPKVGKRKRKGKGQ